MQRFTVPDITCGHCVSTIAKALKTEDPNAKVEISLGQHLVAVESNASAEALAEASPRRATHRRRPEAIIPPRRGRLELSSRLAAPARQK